MIHKTISIRDDQDKWISDEYFNLSKFVQKILDEEIERRSNKE